MDHNSNINIHLTFKNLNSQQQNTGFEMCIKHSTSTHISPLRPETHKNNALGFQNMNKFFEHQHAYDLVQLQKTKTHKNNKLIGLQNMHQIFNIGKCLTF